MTTDRPLLAADLTFVRVNGGRAYSGLADWDEEDHGPTVGEQIQVADGSGGPFEAVITSIDADGTIALSVLAFAPPGAHRLNGL